MAVLNFIPITCEEKQADLCECKVNLVYITSSKPARPIRPCLKKKKSRGELAGFNDSTIKV